MSAVGVNSAFLSTTTVKETGSPGTTGKLIISEVAPWSSTVANSPVAADWFEVTNLGATAVDITGWKMDDNSESPNAAVALNGITSIAAGESVIFIETNDLPGKTATFLSIWFGANPPAGLLIRSYSGSGVGLSTTSDAVNLYDPNNVRQAKVFFAASSAGSTFPTFDNAAGLENAAISLLSAFGGHGAFIAVNDGKEIGFPGTITKTNVTRLGGIDVQNGQTQRSYLRALDMLFDQSSGLMDLINNSRLQLTQFDLNGQNGSLQSFPTPTVVGNRIRFDFGVQGIGGNRNTNAGDGYYELAVDIDGNGSFETKNYFYRLLGDVNGDRKVATADSNLTLSAFGTSNPERDVNGDGFVNANDRTLVLRGLGRKLKESLLLSDRCRVFVTAFSCLDPASSNPKVINNGRTFSVSVATERGGNGLYCGLCSFFRSGISGVNYQLRW